MQKSTFEQMGGTYTQVGDYFIPNLVISEAEQSPSWQIWPDAETLSERASSGAVHQSACDRQAGSALG